MSWVGGTRGFEKNPNLGRGIHARQEIWKNMAFVLIDFEEGCFSLLSLLHLSKKHVPSTCSKILSNIIAKITSGCKV